MPTSAVKRRVPRILRGVTPPRLPQPAKDQCVRAQYASSAHHAYRIFCSAKICVHPLKFSASFLAFFSERSLEGGTHEHREAESKKPRPHIKEWRATGLGREPSRPLASFRARIIGAVVFSMATTVNLLMFLPLKRSQGSSGAAGWKCHGLHHHGTDDGGQMA
jgi:hypothetical protein